MWYDLVDWGIGTLGNWYLVDWEIGKLGIWEVGTLGSHQSTNLPVYQRRGKAINVTDEQHRSNSFVLRVWREESTRPDEWRGWVQHATTGETCYFHRLAELLAFVEAHTGPLAQCPGAEADGRGKEVMVNDQ